MTRPIGSKNRSTIEKENIEKEKSNLNNVGRFFDSVDTEIKSIGSISIGGDTGELRGFGAMKNSGNVNQTDKFPFKKLRSRREFFDVLKEYIQKNPGVEMAKLDAYFQYTTGASAALIRQALAVLENLDMIESIEDTNFPINYHNLKFRIKEK